MRDPIPDDKILSHPQVVRLNHYDAETAGLQIGEKPALQLLELLRAMSPVRAFKAKTEQISTVVNCEMMHAFSGS